MAMDITSEHIRQLHRIAGAFYRWANKNMFNGRSLTRRLPEEKYENN
jgi:hypothetical protein